MENNFVPESKDRPDTIPPSERLAIRLPMPPVTRVNRRTFIVAGALAAVFGAIVLVVGFSDHGRKGKDAAGDANPARPADEFIGEQVRELPKDYSFDVRNAASGIGYASGSTPPTATSTRPPVPSGPTPDQLAAAEERRRLAEARLLLLEQQQKELQLAMDSPLVFSAVKAARLPASASPEATDEQRGDAAPRTSNLEEVRQTLTALSRQNQDTDADTGRSSTNRGSDQTGKEAFMDKAAAVEPYLNKPLLAPLSKYELKAGSVIPGALVTGINTDLPGEIIGQVTQNVYDSATGDYLLIPQGSRLLGKYQSAISNGQNRALVVWRRLIFPNGQSIVLDFMPGTDAAGLAGLKDQVDYHTNKLVGAAALTTALAYAGNLARNPRSNNDGGNGGDVVGDTVAQQANRIGEKIIDRELDVQPTITIRPGWPFRVLVNKDVVLAPYSK